MQAALSRLEAQLEAAAPGEAALHSDLEEAQQRAQQLEAENEQLRQQVAGAGVSWGLGGLGAAGAAGA